LGGECAGDRIVVEWGLYGFTPSIDYDATLRFGDPTATADHRRLVDITTDLCPWIVLNSPLVFGTPPDLFLDGMWG
jgi:hypothetical protein